MGRPGAVAALVAVVLATSVGADVYRWTDENGVVHYSDVAPEGRASTRRTSDEIGGDGFSAAKTLRPDSSPSAKAPRRSVVGSSRWYEGADGYDRALRTMERSGAPMLVYFRTDWCPHCKRLDEMLEDRDVERGLRTMLRVRVNPESGRRERELFEGYEGRAFPSLYVHRGRAAEWTKLSSSGPAAKFVARLERAVAN